MVAEGGDDADDAEDDDAAISLGAAPEVTVKATPVIKDAEVVDAAAKMW